MHAIDLAPHCNACAATFDSERSAGCVNIWGNSFPAEDVPFGRPIIVGGVTYQLVAKQPGAPDHVEALGQRIEIGVVAVGYALGVLGFGELGPQTLMLRLTDRFGAVVGVRVQLPNWLLPRGAPARTATWRASHLHYVGDYELDHLCPAMFSATVPLLAPFWPVTLTIEPNPLAHVMAVTMLQNGGGYV
ncbi:hypothetical protein [Mesorhizobium huakuii]|uniref:Uncharacterized protein n=1 Tax=Mesorhizobium huakuii TaxID=28104 RepID=A0A7G6T515_9HYPH|nr:hypothetical protein [Mesorhizobium huakuii]QND61847.1 hypothetical protein HB778_37325 [Mesorhizobium huakuii]